MSTYEEPRPPNQLTRKDEVNNFTLREKAFYHQFTLDVGNTVIKQVRNFFEKNVRVPADYRWVGIANKNGSIETNQTLSKIHIASAYNDNESMVPGILLENTSLNLLDLWLNHQKMGVLVIKNSRFIRGLEEPEFLEVGYRLGGKMNGTVLLTVRGLTPYECDNLSDLLTFGMVGPIRWNLERCNYNFLPNQGNISNRSAEQTGEAKRPNHLRTHSYGLYLEWYDDFFYDTITVEDVEAGELTILPLSSSG